MAQLTTIIEFLDSYLRTNEFRDDSINGIQVQTSNNNIKKVAVAVDCGLSIVEQACRIEAQLLIVHHGLFWGKDLPIKGQLAKKIELLMKHGCSLYASHLPLDGHSEVGNSFELARFFKLIRIEPFFMHNGQTIGAFGTLAKAGTLDEFIAIGREMVGAKEPLVLPFGNNEIKKVGILTGSGAMALETCANAGLDLLISGEAKQSVYHLAKELKMNAIFFGHYATETFGVRALGKLLKEKYEVDLTFIDEPTGI